MSTLSSLFGGTWPAVFLFDLDGTLVDSVPDIGDAVDRMLVEIGREPAGINKIRSWVGNGSPALVERALANESLTIDELAHRKGTRSAEQQRQFDEAYLLFLDFYSDRIADLSTLYPGAVETLNGLHERNVPMAIVTNKPVRFTEPLLEQLEISKYFDLVVSGDSLEEKKPNALPLVYSAKNFGVAIDKVLMVGDSITDVQAARAAGCKIACVNYGYNYGLSIYDAKPDLVVDSLIQLITPSLP